MAQTAVPTMRARPRRARLVCWIAAALVLAVSVLVAQGLRGQMTASGGRFETADQVAMIGLGVLAALAILMFTRPRVEADASGVRMRNLVGSYDLPWAVVRAVRFGPGTPWVLLDLEDDEVVAVMAVQAADKQYAVAAVRQLRALHAAHHAEGPDPRAPDTPAPDAPKPDTPAADTPTPDTLAPDTPKPDSPAPDTTKPDTPAPDTSAGS